MLFSWEQFCRSNNVSYVRTGPNVAKGNIGIACPLCGDDPSEHLVLSLNVRKPFWYCWRNTEHRGTSPQRLIAALLHCSREVADMLVAAGDVGALDDYELIGARLSAVTEHAPPPVRAQHLSLPKEFKPIQPDTEYGRKFWQYVKKRGFDHLEEFVDEYDLRYCLVGSFANRVVMPIYLEQELIGWTGRDITGTSDLRYNTLSDDVETAKYQGYRPALCNVKSSIYNYDRTKNGGETLFVCEGPFDALKLDWYGREDGDVGVGVFGMPEPGQLAALTSAARAFKRVGVVLDVGASGNAHRLVDALEGICPVPVAWIPLPHGVKDPGEMSALQVAALSRVARKKRLSLQVQSK